MAKTFKPVVDFKHNIVTAESLVQDNIKNFKKGMIFTLRNKEYTFWAEVECYKHKGNTYYFKSVIYGWLYIVDYDNNILLIEE